MIEWLFVGQTHQSSLYSFRLCSMRSIQAVGNQESHNNCGSHTKIRNRILDLGLNLDDELVQIWKYLR
jgi:hypothetical protein